VDSVVEDSCKLASHRVTSGGKPDVSPPPGGVNPLIDVTDVNLILKEKVKLDEERRTAGAKRRPYTATAQ